eukprot:m51a1_g4251 hypothetical protein (338) ;mRNA; f:206515-208646
MACQSGNSISAISLETGKLSWMLSCTQGASWEVLTPGGEALLSPAPPSRPYLFVSCTALTPDFRHSMEIVVPGAWREHRQITEDAITRAGEAARIVDAQTLAANFEAPRARWADVSCPCECVAKVRHGHVQRCGEGGERYCFTLRRACTCRQPTQRDLLVVVDLGDLVLTWPLRLSFCSRRRRGTPAASAAARSSSASASASSGAGAGADAGALVPLAVPHVRPLEPVLRLAKERKSHAPRLVLSLSLMQYDASDEALMKREVETVLEMVEAIVSGLSRAHISWLGGTAKRTLLVITAYKSFDSWIAAKTLMARYVANRGLNFSNKRQILYRDSFAL